MKYQIFQYRLPMEGQPDDLNRWLASHRIVGVKQYLVQNEGAGHLVFVVESAGEAAVPLRSGEARIDYKEKLTEADFAVFSRLRSLRKELAEREGVPVYAVFSNAQLAEMVEKRIVAPEKLGALDGVGEGKVAKYGPSVLKSCWPASRHLRDGGFPSGL